MLNFPSLFLRPPLLETRSLSEPETHQLGYAGCLMNFRDQPVSTLPSLGLQESTATMLSWLQELWASELCPSCLQVKHFPVQAILSTLKSLREPAHKNERRNDRKFLCWKQTLLLLKHMNNCNYFMWGRILRSQSHVYLFTMTFTWHMDTDALLHQYLWSSFSYGSEILGITKHRYYSYVAYILPQLSMLLCV